MNRIEQLPVQQVFSTTMSNKARVGFGLAAAFPLLAPYELLIRPNWTGAPGLALLFAVIISAGATAVSVLLLIIALFGINRRVEFDTANKMVRVTESHLMQSKREFDYPFSKVAQLELVCHDWSDGPSTYDIRLTPHAGKPFAFGDFSSRVEAETAVSSLRAIMGRTI